MFRVPPSRSLLKEMNQAEIIELGRDIFEKRVLFFENQDLSKSDLAHICRSLGNTDQMGQHFSDKEFPELTRVTNEYTNGEQTGFLPYGELDWHCNRAFRPIERIGQSIIALYCVDPGLSGSTSFLDSVLLYESLEEDFKRLVDDLEGFLVSPETYSRPEVLDGIELVDQHKFGAPLTCWKSLVCKYPRHLKAPRSVTSLMFMPTYVKKFRRKSNGSILSEKEFSHIHELLNSKINDPSRSFTHPWKSGDIVFCDQFQTLHRRSVPSGKRLLYRVGTNYDNVF